MGMKKEKSAVLYNYKELFMFILFSVFCAVLAWTRGCLNEFGNIEFWLVLMGVVLLFVTVELKANRLLLLTMLLLMTVGNLIRACLEVYHYHDGSYKGVNRDYIFSFIIIVAVMILYPKFHKILSSNIAIALMAAATFGIYALLLVFGQSVGGVKAWFYGIQLTEPVKILFIFVIAGLLSKKQSFTGSVLAILYMVMNGVCLAAISEYGTLIIMVSVFLIFLFIFPNKLWWLGGVLLVGTVGVVILYLMGSGIYSEAMEQSSPQVFAETFSGNIRNIQNKDGETVDGIDVLVQIIDESIKESPDEDSQRVFQAAKKKLTDGKVSRSDFSAKNQGAVEMLTALCGDHAFRQKFIDTFCRDDFYGYTAVNALYGSTGSGPVHAVKHKILDLYNKIVQRFVIPFTSKELQLKLLGGSSQNAVYQTNQGAKAMRIGGLTGSGSHEFIQVVYMKSDMVFTQVVTFFGFTMGLFVILMYMIMFREGIRIQQSIEKTPFHQGVALGIALMLFVHALVIMAGNLRIFPLTGITLPFIADGSVSLYVCVMKVALLLTISFIEIKEQTGASDAFFGWLMRALGAGAADKIRRVSGHVGGLGKKVSGGAKELKDELVQKAAEESDLEEDFAEEDADNDSGDEDGSLSDIAQGLKNWKKDSRMSDSCEEEEVNQESDQEERKMPEDREPEQPLHKDRTRPHRMHQSKNQKKGTIFDEWEEDQSEEDDDGL